MHKKLYVAFSIAALAVALVATSGAQPAQADAPAAGCVRVAENFVSGQSKTINGVTLTFTSTGEGVATFTVTPAGSTFTGTIRVKGGSGYFDNVFPTPVTSGTVYAPFKNGVSGPRHGISHIDICFAIVTTPSPSPSPTLTPLGSPSPIVSPSPTPSDTPTPTPTPSDTPTPTPSVSPLGSPSPIVSFSPSPEVSPSPSPEASPSPSLGPQGSPSPIVEVSPSPSPPGGGGDGSPSPSPSLEPLGSPSPIVNPSPTPEVSPSPTPEILAFGGGTGGNLIAGLTPAVGGGTAPVNPAAPGISNFANTGGSTPVLNLMTLLGMMSLALGGWLIKPRSA